MRQREALELKELADLDAGRAVVILNDGETWTHLIGSKVVIYDEQETWEDGFPRGYSEIGLDVLVRHFLQTKP